MTLDRYQRQVLFNQYQILRALYPDEAGYYEELSAVVRDGYELFYGDLFTVDSTPVPDVDCRFVLDTLSVFQFVDWYIEKHPEDTEVAAHPWARFRGFDGTHEPGLLGFVRFLFEKHNRFAFLNRSRAGNFNSATPVRRIYQRMVEAKAGRPFNVPHGPSRDDVLAILAASRGEATR